MSEEGASSEGGLGAPERHALAWRDADFYDDAALEAETRRAFDICHGCRRCFNLCASFPRLFELIDAAPTGELESVDASGFAPVVEACTLCDMCFMTKCPYVPPHPFGLDIPHLMLRHKAVARKKRRFFGAWGRRQLARQDRNGRLAALAPFLANWAARRGNRLTRWALEVLLGIDRRAALPRFHRPLFMRRAASISMRGSSARKARFFPGCYVNANAPQVGEAAMRLLAHCGVDVRPVYPGCCAMPLLEDGDIAGVARAAETISAALRADIDAGCAIIVPTASCALMFRNEWPLILPDNDNVAALARASYDITHYIVEMARAQGLPKGARGIQGGVAVHLACHARAQNTGPKAVEMLRLLPDTQIDVVERCSGHGGVFGVMRETYPLAVKAGVPVVRAIKKSGARFVVSSCPLAAKHIAHQSEGAGGVPPVPAHPVEIMAHAYGLAGAPKAGA